MKQNTTGVVTMLEPRKWLLDVEKIGLLNLLWVSHFHRVPITISSSGNYFSWCMMGIYG